MKWHKGIVIKSIVNIVHLVLLRLMNKDTTVNVNEVIWIVILCLCVELNRAIVVILDLAYGCAQCECHCIFACWTKMAANQRSCS